MIHRSKRKFGFRDEVILMKDHESLFSFQSDLH